MQAMLVDLQYSEKHQHLELLRYLWIQKCSLATLLTSHMLKTWPTKIFPFWILFCPSFSKRFCIRMSNLACMSGPLQCRLHFAKSVGDMSSAQHAACSINNAACSIMTVPMFTDNTDPPLRSGWRSCCLAPQHLALTGLLTSRGWTQDTGGNVVTLHSEAPYRHN